MTVKSKRTYLKCWSLVAAIHLLAVPSLTVAKPFLCDAKQASTSELPILDKSCPIGRGMWGKSRARGTESVFWIQCGLYSKPLSLSKAKKLYQHISTDVWAKPENRAYRCLIGPYDKLSLARQDLSQVKSVAGYKDAFIREVIKGAPVKSSSKKASKLKPAVKPAAKVKSHTAKVTKSTKATKATKTAKATQAKNLATKVTRQADKVKAQATTVIPPPTRKAPVKIKSNPQKVTKPQDEISIRLSTKVAGVEYKIPYRVFGDDQFYMEHDLPWNRLDYTGAYKTCYRLGMRLATAGEWQALLDSKVMQKNRWPMHLPYWGAEKNGLFTSGKVNKLKGSSLLNLMCVK